MGLESLCAGKKTTGLRDVYAETLIELAETNEDIVVLDADLSQSTRTARFGAKFPERFFNMGISEQDMIGTAAGLALAGKVPFASTFAIFEAGRAWEQIRLALCLTHLPVKLVSSHGGITVGEDGPTHHCTEDAALMRVLPNMTVVFPADACEMRAVIIESMSMSGPLYVRGSREKFPNLNCPDTEFQIGKARVLRDGSDIAIIACGLMVDFSLQAAEMLKQDGYQARVINMSTLKPVDQETAVAAARDTGLVLTVEEHSIIGGLGSAVCEVLSEHCPATVKRMGVPDQFAASGTPCELLEMCGLTPKNIRKTAFEMLSGGRSPFAMRKARSPSSKGEALSHNI
ncbi:MAG: transketolase family protein [Candidatus Coatesbacteria bacterium]|nr:transketolase family protein [Candidatus Coatesbacteria bacterium]